MEETNLYLAVVSLTGALAVIKSIQLTCNYLVEKMTDHN